MFGVTSECKPPNLGVWIRNSRLSSGDPWILTHQPGVARVLGWLWGCWACLELEKRRLEQVTEHSAGDRVLRLLSSIVCVHLTLVSGLTPSVSSPPHMFWLLSRRWHCCPRKLKPRSGTPGFRSSLQGRGVWWLSVSSVHLHLAEELPFSSHSLSMFYLVCPGTFSLVYFFPTPTVPVDGGISTHLLSLIHPSFENKHRALMTWQEKAGAACCQLPGRASLPAGLWSKLWPRGKESS